MHHPLGSEVMEHGGDVQGHRNHLLQRQRAGPTLHLAQRRPLDVLEQHVRVRALEHGIEAAHQHRMGQARERVDLAAQSAPGAVVFQALGPQHLGDAQREAMIVPHKVGGVQVPAFYVPHHRAAGRDLIAFGQDGAVVAGCAHRLIPTARGRDAGRAGLRFGLRLAAAMRRPRADRARTVVQRGATRSRKGPGPKRPLLIMRRGGRGFTASITAERPPLHRPRE